MQVHVNKIRKIYYLNGYHKLVKVKYEYKNVIHLTTLCESINGCLKSDESQKVSKIDFDLIPKIELDIENLDKYDFLECNTVEGYRVTEIPYFCKYLNERILNGKKNKKI